MDSHLLRFQDKQRYVIWDCETEALNLSIDNKPWQLGFLICEGNRILETHTHFIRWPNLNISKDAARVTRFDINLYNEKAEEPNYVLDKFDSYLYDEKYINIGHNIVSFDIYIHNIYRKLLGKKTDYSYVNRSIDTNSLAKILALGIKPEIERKDWKTWMFRMSSFYRKGMKTNLTAMGKSFNIDADYNNLHQASLDVDLNFKVWNKMKYMVHI